MPEPLSYTEFKKRLSPVVDFKGNDARVRKAKLGSVLSSLGDDGEQNQIIAQAVKSSGVRVQPNERAKTMRNGKAHRDIAWSVFYYLHRYLPDTEGLDDFDRSILGRTVPEFLRRDVDGRPQISNEFSDQGTTKEKLDTDSEEPELWCPDSTNWLSPFNEMSVPFLARQRELDALGAFLSSPSDLSVWAVIGPSGSGKTRLVAHWTKMSNDLQGWHKGFVTDVADDRWLDWTPQANTLIVIDDTLCRSGIVATILKRARHIIRAGSTPWKIRLLVIDRYFPDNLALDSVWGPAFSSSFDLDAQETIFYRDNPLTFADQNDVVGQLIATSSLGAEAQRSVLSTIDGLGGGNRPLFALIAIDQVRASGTSANKSRWALLEDYLDGNDRLPWLNEVDLGFWVGKLVVYASVFQDCSWNELAKLLPEEISGNFQAVSTVRDMCQRISGGEDTEYVSGLAPDFLAQAFFLMFLKATSASPHLQSSFVQGLQNLSSKNHYRGHEFMQFIRKLGFDLEDMATDQHSFRNWEILKRFLQLCQSDASGEFEFLALSARMEIANAAFRCAALDQAIDCSKGITSEDLEISECLQQLSSLNALTIFLDNILSNNLGKMAEEFATQVVEHPNSIGLQAGRLSYFHMACANNCASLTEFILSKHDVVNLEDDRGSTGLIAASELGYVRIVELLLEKGADPNHIPHSTGCCALLWASQMGHISVCKKLLKSGAQVDLERPDDKATPLMMAAAHGHTRLVQDHVQAGANIDQIGAKEGVTALTMSVARGDFDMAKTLLKLGANPDIAAPIPGETAIMQAIHTGNATMAALVLEAGANPNLALSKRNFFPLLGATAKDQVEIAKLLVSHGANIDEMSEDGMSALSMAFTQRHLELGDWFVEQGANLNVLWPSKVSPLGWIVSKGDFARTKSFIAAGADVNLSGYLGMSPAAIACDYQAPEILGHLLDQGAEVNGVEEEVGWTLLMRAIHSGDPQSVALLLKHGADPLERSSKFNVNSYHFCVDADDSDMLDLLLGHSGGTEVLETSLEFPPLLLASNKNASKTISWLVQQGFSPNQVYEDQGTIALVNAARFGCTDALESLLDAGAEPNSTAPADGSTALMFACQEGFNNIVEALLVAGADPNKKRERDGATAMLVAVTHENTGAIKLLSRFNADLEATFTNGPTALMAAVAQNKNGVVRTLLQCGSDPNTKINGVISARFFAAVAKNTEAETELASCGAEKLSKLERWSIFQGRIGQLIYKIRHRKRLRDKKTESANFAMMDACVEGDWEKLSEAISNGANPRFRAPATDHDALMIACEEGHIEIVQLLLDAKLDPDRVSEKTGWWSLGLASSQGYIEISRELLARGADVNLASWGGRTALSVACDKGHFDTVRLLAEAGADLSHKNEDGLTAEKASVAAGFFEIADYLRDAANFSEVR